MILRLETKLARAGVNTDPRTGSIATPVYQTATFRHPGVGRSTGYDYTRSGNPTRQVLEETAAELEGGARGLAFASGMAAITAVLLLFEKGDHLIVSEDLYGGTYRVLDRVFARWGLEVTFVDTTDLGMVESAFTPATRAVFVETPTNPLLKVADLDGLARLAHARQALLVVDNTFLTPYLQRPIEFGADIVVHSATKYLAGHNDVVAGLLVAADRDLGERLWEIQNSTGGVLGPQDSWLTLRGMKTLAVRLERQQETAGLLARWLATRPEVDRVYYPGLPTHAGHALMNRQAAGPGAMLSFSVRDPELVHRVLSRVEVFLYAESLGGVESLITFPALQTHGDLPPEERLRLGITDRLLRVSVGLEAFEDLQADLTHALTGRVVA